MNRGYDVGKGGRPSALSISPRLESGRKKLLDAVLDAVAAGMFSPGNPTERAGRRRMGMDITWVTDRIAVGGGIWTAENMAVVSRTGVTHIIDMQIEFDDTPLAEKHGIAVCWNPIDDDFEPKPAAVFDRGVEFALSALEENGSKLYVHCAAGVHRAPMMTLAILGVMGWTVESGIKLIEARRPVADFAEVYVRSVEDFLQGRR